MSIATGIQFASGKEMPDKFFEHITDRPDEAKLMQFRRGANG